MGLILQHQKYLGVINKENIFKNNRGKKKGSDETTL